MVSGLLRRIRRGVIGDGEIVDGPFGPRRVTFADYTASGRSLDFIEDAIRGEVLPRYANSGAGGSCTGLNTLRLREEARRIIHDGVRGGENDLVIFCGSGATGAINKLVAILGLRLPASLSERYRLTERIPANQRPVVFIGPHEHPSNELPWRESIADVEVIAADPDGRVDPQDLRGKLLRYADRPLRIGSFAAASNLTGVLLDTSAIATALHQNAALSVWDYALAGPHLPIQMGETSPGRRDHKDAVFLSPHTFVGGPQTPGVLVVRSELVSDRVPTCPGGGTVEFVDPLGYRYLEDPVAREEGGTPAVVESIRAGLVFALKQAVGAEAILASERRLWSRVWRRWRAESRIELLGDPAAERLAIASFRIRYGRGWLHHNFVTALLNDMFGIQARAACSCAGSYGHRLLTIEAGRSSSGEAGPAHRCDGMKPGWCLIGLNYFVSDTVADFVAEAVALLAEGGARLLRDYRFEPRSGAWRHHSAAWKAAVRLADIRFQGDGTIVIPGPRAVVGEETLAGYLGEARAAIASRSDPSEDEPSGLPADLEALRWFPLSPECLTGGAPDYGMG